MSGDSSLVKIRLHSFLIWQCIESTLVFSVLRFSPVILPNINNSKWDSLVPFICFQGMLYSIRRTLSLLDLSVFGIVSILILVVILSAFYISLVIALRFTPPHPVPQVASPFDPVSRAGEPLPRHFRIYISYAVFIAVAGVLASLSLVILCGLRWVIHGLVVGFIYALDYLYWRRWTLCFPIIQRSPSSSFVVHIPVAALRALQLSVVASVISIVLTLPIRNESEAHATFGQFIFQQIPFFAGIFMVFLFWELNHHLHQVLHTRRVVFAPPEGVAAAETNPSEPLLAALEESTPSSLIHYLACLDLLMVCENNVDTSRRATFFEETGETYKRLIDACLKPLEKLISELGEGLESYNLAEKSFELSNQLNPPTFLQSESRILEAFYDFQLCAWCARIAASLTVRLHEEGCFDFFRFPSYASVMSALLSCLLAVEAVMGKKTYLQSQQITDQTNFRWNTRISGRREVAANGLIVKRNSVYSKAYSMADILRTSIYCIVSAFHNEMTSSDLLDRVWVTNKPLFGTREIHLQKLRLFVEFRAN